MRTPRGAPAHADLPPALHLGVAPRPALPQLLHAARRLVDHRQRPGGALLEEHRRRGSHQAPGRVEAAGLAAAVRALSGRALSGVHRTQWNACVRPTQCPSRHRRSRG